MNAIVARLRTLLAFIVQHTITVDLTPNMETTEAMVKAYFRGEEHLRSALREFLIAEELWDKLHEEDEP